MCILPWLVVLIFHLVIFLPGEIIRRNFLAGDFAMPIPTVSSRLIRTQLSLVALG
jgi:hypothetical protein